MASDLDHITEAQFFHPKDFIGDADRIQAMKGWRRLFVSAFSVRGQLPASEPVPWRPSTSQALLQQAVEEVAMAVDAEYVKIMEYRPATQRT